MAKTRWWSGRRANTTTRSSPFTNATPTKLAIAALTIHVAQYVGIVSVIAGFVGLLVRNDQLAYISLAVVVVSLIAAAVSAYIVFQDLRAVARELED